MIAIAPLTPARNSAMISAGARHTLNQADSRPDSAALSCLNFGKQSAETRPAAPHGLGGQEGHCASVAAWLGSCVYTCSPILCARHARDGFLVHQGTKTMTVVTTPAKGQSTPAAGMPSAIKTESLPHVLGAFNACNLAASYIERGNMPAARRKLVQALASINQLQGVAA